MDSLAVTNYKSDLIGETPETVIQQCTIDVLFTNNLLWARFHVEALNNKVKREFQLNPVEVANNTQYVEAFLENTCQNNCSNRVVCSKTGKCECSTGYHGPDCGIDAREPIGVDYIEGGNLCDLSDSGSCRCFYVYTTQLIRNFSCKFIIREVDVHYNSITSTSILVVGELSDIFSGICCLPERPVSATYVTLYDIALSNSGTDFGDVFTVTVYDSTCQSVVVNEDGKSTAVLKVGHCFIDGQCVEDGGVDLNDQCMRCNSSLNVFKWANVCEPPITPSSGASSEPPITSSSEASSEPPITPSSGASSEPPITSSSGVSSEPPITSLSEALSEPPITPSSGASREPPITPSSGASSKDHPNITVIVVVSVIALLVIILIAGIVMRQKWKKIAKWIPQADNNGTNMQSDLRTFFDFENVFGYRRTSSSGELLETSINCGYKN